MPHKQPTQLQGITDLTLIAEIKPGLVEGIFESKSYTWRLNLVLGLLDAGRRASREVDLLPNPLVDRVGRFRGIHFFRFAILPPGDRLLLNVTFDGGWETYMRIVWGPLGSMLDLIFCHCEGYRLAAASSFEDYIGWVREHEVPSQFFFADSCDTVADHAYLKRLQAQQLAAGEDRDAALRAALTALKAEPPPQPTPAAVEASIRALKHLYGLVQVFGEPVAATDSPATDDGSVLHRFARDFLPELVGWAGMGLLTASRSDSRLPGFERELQWFQEVAQLPRPKKRKAVAEPDREAVQAGILGPLKAPAGRHGRGALVLARVIQRDAARQWLAAASVPASGERTSLISDGRTVELTVDDVACTVAVSYSGLRQLGVSEEDLAGLPAEFVQGMEARAGVLGDLRTNHPQQWNRPVANWKASGAPRAPVDLALVHVVIQLRTCEGGGGGGKGEGNGGREGEGEGEGDGTGGTSGTSGIDRSGLMKRLEQWIEKNLSETSGLQVLAVEATWSRPRPKGLPAARDHFGYADGISQPELDFSAGNPACAGTSSESESPRGWDNTVNPGEVLLGWINDRGDGPPALPGGKPPWLADGTFLVVRKIRQFARRFDAVIEKAADALVSTSGMSHASARELVRSKLMGRRSDGSPLVATGGKGENDFDFRDDPAGGQCPFASHVRRANPREPFEGSKPPRIVRRGMAYGLPADADRLPAAGAETDRGVLFMAYNASIAEQFEVIQRWLTGGNSSGVSSSQSDPLLGVPRAGQPTLFAFVHEGRLIRVDLGDQPLCRLEWGLYAFVPSMALLRSLAEPASSGPSESAPPVAQRQRSSELERRLASSSDARQRQSAYEDLVKAEFEDETSRSLSWDRVRCSRGVERFNVDGTPPATPALMVGSLAAVLQVLQDDGRNYSAGGYGQRMKKTLGPSPFGQDNAGPHRGHERAFVEEIKKAIEASVTEADAYAESYRFVATRLGTLLENTKNRGSPAASIELIALGVDLLAHLFEVWFGVLYDDGVTERGAIGPAAVPVRCPGHFLSAARYVFSAYPNDRVKAVSRRDGEALKAWTARFSAAADGAGSTSAGSAGTAPVLAAVLGALPMTSGGEVLTAEERAGIVANVMLGMPATLLGTWAKVVRAWTVDRSLWRLQHDLSRACESPAQHGDARRELRRELIATMALDPVADGIWRTVAKSGTLAGLGVEKGDVVWLGLTSALSETLNDPVVTEALMFGGSRDPAASSGSRAPLTAPHACPGRNMAVGTLLGALAALLQSGELATTANPLVLSLKPLRS